MYYGLFQAQLMEGVGGFRSVLPQAQFYWEYPEQY